MIKQPLRRVRSAAMLSTTLGMLASHSAFAQMTSTATPPAQAAVPADETTNGMPAEPANQSPPAASTETQDIIVTGSRVVGNGNQAPTPVTVVTTERLLQNTPSSIPDALRTLPQFGVNSGPRNGGLGGANSGANTLNLRNIGPQRVLILLDGKRVQPSNTAGSVDVDTMPELLVQRIDIVTGGASAVYGSDAISGVVNYVLDKKFVGLKGVGQYGISDRGDAQNYKVGIAAGIKIFGDRGHIEGSYLRNSSRGIRSVYDREIGARNVTLVGAGTAANPFTLVENGRYLSTVRGGYISSGPSTIVDTVFKTNGLGTPFAHGIATGSTGTESGGDGTFVNAHYPLTPLKSDQYFGRFDFKVTPAVTFYGMINYNRNYTRYPAISPFILNTFGRILSGNPFIPTDIQSKLTAAGATSFTINRMEDIRDHANDGIYPITAESITRSFFSSAGFEGKILDRFDWNVQYNHGRTAVRVNNIGNINAERLAAALDVISVNGRPTCYILTTEYASRFPGCQPFNPFGPTAPTQGAYDFVRGTTTFNLVNTMDDFAGTLSGTLFDLPHGPVRASVNSEYRRMGLSNVSNAQPSQPLDCRGLRANCAGPGITPWTQSITADLTAKQTVKEVAAELLIPIFADIPFFKSLDFNLAGRYAKYDANSALTPGSDASFSARTWKIGVSWQLTDDLRLRGARSKEFRAPNLFDLFSPTSVSPSGLIDLHTGNTVGAPFVYSRGNPGLTPELAKVWTGGVVYQAGWAPGLSVALDYFNVSLSDAITLVNGTSQLVQLQCEQSNGVSPFCALYERPFGFDNRTPANFPTRVFAQNLNAASIRTHGWDFELNYATELSSFSSLPGRLALRSLVSYQPVFNTITLPGSPIDHAAGVGALSKIRVNTNLVYTVGGLSVSVQDRWQSKNDAFDRTRIFYNVPDFAAKNYVDLTVSYAARLGGHELRPFFSVQNLTDTQPPIAGTGAQSPGLTYPAAPGYDIIGRQYTFGLRANF